MIRFGKISHLTATGKRNNNEDSFRIGENGVFVVCDGVGGVEKGEVASEIVADTLISIFRDNPDAIPENALQEAEKALSEHIKTNPDSAGMATTLTFSQVREDGILVAWVGDSRVYQFRKGQIIYQTKDHSWVNEAVEAGILTPEEAVNHPKSNVITRAVQGMDRPAKPDKVLLKDIRPGDCIMHCSDGVLEAWDDEDLSALFNSSDDVDAMINELASYCEKESRDNYTAIIYTIDAVSISPSSESTLPEPTRVLEPLETNEGVIAYSDTVKTKETWLTQFLNLDLSFKHIAFLLMLLSFFLFTFLTWKPFGGMATINDSARMGKQNPTLEKIHELQRTTNSDSVKSIGVSSAEKYDSIGYTPKIKDREEDTVKKED
jgi:serine/threonine protein phosphatase PrpC